VPLPPHSRIVVADAQALAYEMLPGASLEREIYACTFGARRANRLGEALPSVTTSQGISGVTLEALGGPVVGYETVSGDFDTIIVRDLRSGRVLHRLLTGIATHPEPGFRGSGPARALVVKSNGAVVWIAVTRIERVSPLSPTVIGEDAVEAVGTTGAKLLASGTLIDTSSLALANSRLYWMHGGRPAYALLN
jgi:hypothetical protein